MKKFILTMFMILALSTNVNAESERKVKVSSNDSTSGFLNGKLVAGSNITFLENNDGSNETLQISAVTSGSGMTLDLADDSSNESTSLAEIATSGDTNSIFSEPSADKLHINLSNDWPKADTADDLTCTNCIGDTEILETSLETGLEAVLDLQDLQGAVTDVQVPDNITVTNYLLLSGGTLTGQLVTDNLGIEFEESDTNPLCAAGNYNIFADLSEGKFKKCTNGVATDLDTSSSGGYATIEDEDTPLTQRTTLNFEGAGVSCADDTTKTTCTIPGAGSATITVEEDNVTVSASVSDIDFGSGFDVTEAPAGEANVVMDLSENVTGDVTFNTSNVSTIQANSVALSTDTTGNYVMSITNGTSITGGDGGSEGAALTLDVVDDGINGTELADNITVDGSNLRLGDGGSNYSQVGTNGALTYAGTAKPARTVILTSGGATLPATNFPASTTIDGTNVDYKVLEFDASTDESIYYTFIWPDSWDAGTISARFRWLAASTSGDVVWAIQTACVADDEAVDATLNTANTVTDTTKATTLEANDADIASVTVTGCAAGEIAHIKIYRDADNGSDTMTGDARLIYTKMEYISNAESD